MENLKNTVGVCVGGLNKVQVKKYFNTLERSHQNELAEKQEEIKRLIDENKMLQKELENSKYDLSIQSEKTDFLKYALAKVEYQIIPLIAEKFEEEVKNIRRIGERDEKEFDKEIYEIKQGLNTVEKLFKETLNLKEEQLEKAIEDLEAEEERIEVGETEIEVIVPKEEVIDVETEVAETKEEVEAKVAEDETEVAESKEGPGEAETIVTEPKAEIVKEKEMEQQEIEEIIVEVKVEETIEKEVEEVIEEKQEEISEAVTEVVTEKIEEAKEVKEKHVEVTEAAIGETLAEAKEETSSMLNFWGAEIVAEAKEETNSMGSFWGEEFGEISDDSSSSGSFSYSESLVAEQYQTEVETTKKSNDVSVQANTQVDTQILQEPLVKGEILKEKVEVSASKIEKEEIKKIEEEPKKKEETVKKSNDISIANKDLSGKIANIRSKYLIGKIVGEDLMNGKGQLIARRNAVITEDLIEVATREGVIAELIVNMIFSETSE